MSWPRELFANDATCRPLEAWIELSGTALRLVIDDRDARYGLPHAPIDRTRDG